MNCPPARYYCIHKLDKYTYSNILCGDDWVVINSLKEYHQKGMILESSYLTQSTPNTTQLL